MRQHDDRIGETSTTTGTVPFVLAGAIGGHRTFASVSADGEKRVYHADDENGNWEVGLGTYNESANTFRAASDADVWASSDSGNLVDFPAGTKHILHGQSAEEVPFIRNPGDPRWQVPAADGANNQLLATDGSGQLKWVNPASLDDAVILAPETSTRNVITPAAVDVVALAIEALPGTSPTQVLWRSDGPGGAFTELEARGIQKWRIGNPAGTVRGSVEYTTPGDEVGIIFRDTDGSGRSQVRRLSGGGLGFGSGSGIGNPGDQVAITGGALLVGTTIPAGQRFRVVGGPSQLVNSDLTTNRDLEITPSDRGVILRSPDSTRFRVTIDNSGNLQTASL